MDSPPKGIGADTGAFEFVVAAEELNNAGPTKEHSICLFESPDGRRAGPLLLTVALSSSLMGPAADQQYGFASRIGGVTVFQNDYTPDPIPASDELQFVGSLILDIQVGAVRRRLVADLRAGTYQLPPCDSVMVTAALRNPGSDVGGSVHVAASVTPGTMNNAVPLLYTATEWYLIDDGANVTLSQFFRPSGARLVRGVMLMWLQDPTVFGAAPPPTQAIGSSPYLNTYAQLTAEWLDVSTQPWVYTRWAFPNVVAPARAIYLAGVQWRIDP